MKKKFFFSVLFFIISMSILNTTSFATFEITDFIINSELYENGDLYVNEIINYYSNENDNGVTRKIITQNPRNKTNSADLLELYNVIVDGKIYNQTSYGNVGDEGVYEYTTDGNYGYNIKVYTPFNSNNKTVEYSYILKNVGVVYNDIAEIYWNFIGDEWDCNINNLEINIELPIRAADYTSYVFGHGADNGSFIKERNYITLYAKDIKANQPIDARILFNKSAINSSKKLIDKNVLQDYINKEEGLSSKVEDVKVIGDLSVKEISLICLGIISAIMILIYIKYDKENKTEKFRYFRDIPFNLAPEILQYFYYGRILSSSYYIAVLNLVKLGVFKLENSINEVGREIQKLIYNKNNEVDLKEYQKDIKKNIVNKMEIDENGEKSIELSKLGSKLSSSSEKSYKKYMKSLKAEKESLVGKPKKVPAKIKFVPILCLILLMILILFVSNFKQNIEESIFIIFMMGFLTLVYSIFFIAVGNSVFTFVFLLFHGGAFQAFLIGAMVTNGLGFLYIPYLLIFIFIVYVWRIEKFSKEENDIKEKIRGLRRYIKDYSMIEDKDNIAYINLWEDYFILAIALKLNKNTINYFYEYGKGQVHSNLGNSMHKTNNYMHFHYEMNSAFYRYAKSGSSSSSSGSSYSGSRGGFSGGSSSGGGGGRRWRRRTLLKN